MGSQYIDWDLEQQYVVVFQIQGFKCARMENATKDFA